MVTFLMHWKQSGFQVARILWQLEKDLKKEICMMKEETV